MAQDPTSPPGAVSPQPSDRAAGPLSSPVPTDPGELLAQAGRRQGALGKTTESSHLRHMVLLCGLLLLLLLNEQLLLLPAPGCPQFFEASLHLLQHLGSVAYHQLDAVLGRLQQLHRLLVVFPFHALGAGRTDLITVKLLRSTALSPFSDGKAVGVLASLCTLHFSRGHQGKALSKIYALLGMYSSSYLNNPNLF